MKRIVSLVLALSMVLSMFSFSFAASTLKDISGTKYEPAVEALMELGVVDGYPDGTYLPNNVVTRAELAKLLVTAYGLSQAAEVASGATPFSDVAGNWAAGYINVSADYKFVNGYPDGTFMPNETVTYAEAITMCLRVLGYAKEVDSKGTWPTNYIAKAQDLKLIKDLEFKSYNDGATRGNIALLIWNMLRTKMWTVVGESEGDGLESRANTEMLNVKFPDYAYSKNVTFEGFTIGSDSKANKAKVEITVRGIAGKDVELDKTTYEYAKNDFYQFVPGTEVEVLVNEEDGVLLSIVSAGNDTIVNGTKEDVDDKYDELVDVDYEYAYARVESKKLVEPVTLTSESLFVDKFEAKDKTVKINKKSYDDSDWDTALILKNGERIALRDVKEGDILTTVTVSYDGKEVETFYVVGGTSETGKLTKYVVDSYEDSKVEYVALTVGGEEYKLDKAATYAEDPEADNVKAVEFYNKNYNDKMKGEEVVLRLDPIFGNVVRVEFDGKIDGGEDGSDIQFFGIASSVERADSKTYNVTLVNEAGEKEYTFAKGAGKEIAKELYDEDVEGYFAMVTLNDDGEIKDIELLARADKNGKSSNSNVGTSETKVAFGSGDDDNYVYRLVRGAKYDKDEEAIMEGTKEVVPVDDTVVVITLKYDDKDEEYSVSYEKGLEGIEKLKDEDVIVVWDESDDYTQAKYVVLFDKADNSDNKVAYVKKSAENKINKNYTDVRLQTSDDEREDVLDKVGEGLVEDDVIVYTTKEKDDDLVLTVVSKLTDIAEDGFAYVSKANGTTAIVDGDEVRYGVKANQDKYEDYMLVVVDVDEEGKVEAVSSEKFADLALQDFDRISIDDANEVFYVIRGLEEKEETTTNTTTDTTTSGDTTSGEQA
ncbi:MAG: S-layer homology domain-containing protein [Clostridia bacterium]|nr:S-layer homology domain-containing protein [Clostridia bacterium]